MYNKTFLCVYMLLKNIYYDSSIAKIDPIAVLSLSSVFYVGRNAKKKLDFKKIDIVFKL